MSLDATIWAWKVRQKQKKGGSIKPLKKLVLLSLADRASEDHCAYPSVARLVEDTEMDRKTVLKIIDELIEDGLIVDTGERKGRTKQVKVYQLMGVNGRETVPLTVHFNDEFDEINSPKDGTVPKMEQSQQFHERVPTIPLNSPNVGTRNLSKNLSLESKNKKDWLCFKKLREEIFLADDSIDFEMIVKSNWSEREKRAFEIYNADKNLCDDLMNFHFADWLINAYRTKYSNETRKGEGKSPVGESVGNTNSDFLVFASPSQMYMFANKLARHPEVISKYSTAGESYENLAGRIAVKLADPQERQNWKSYLADVGFKPKGRGAAA